MQPAQSAISTETLDSLWDRTIEAFLAHARETPVLINEVLTRFPDFALAPLVKGCLLLSLGRSELLGPARECLATGKALLAVQPDTRTALFATALESWLDGKPRSAIHAMERVIDDHPRDALAIKLSHAIRFVLGDADGMRRSLSRVISVFGDDVPYAGYVRGCYAFALEETGAYAEAKEMGLRAVKLAPRDAWGRHAVAHVFEMEGRALEGVGWLEGQEASWSHCGNFSYHMFWHLALFQMELGRHSEVLALYDRAIRAEQTDDYRDIANAASLLERLVLAGVPVGDRWEELAEIAGRRTDDRRLVFADLHYLLALLGARRLDQAQALVSQLMRDARIGHSHDARVADDVGAPLAAALLAFQGERYSEAARLIGPVRHIVRQIGGSHAQRDIFEQIYLESLVRAGAKDAACHALGQRLRERGGHNLFATKRLRSLGKSNDAQGRLAISLIGLTPGATEH